MPPDTHLPTGYLNCRATKWHHFCPLGIFTHSQESLSKSHFWLPPDCLHTYFILPPNCLHTAVPQSDTTCQWGVTPCQQGVFTHAQESLSNSHFWLPSYFLHTANQKVTPTCQWGVTLCQQGKHWKVTKVAWINTLVLVWSCITTLNAHRWETHSPTQRFQNLLISVFFSIIRFELFSSSFNGWKKDTNQ